MPKIKTHRGAAKRFNKTGTGKVTHAKAFKQHILTSKTTNVVGTYVARLSCQPPTHRAWLG